MENCTSDTYLVLEVRHDASSGQVKEETWGRALEEAFYDGFDRRFMVGVAVIYQLIRLGTSIGEIDYLRTTTSALAASLERTSALS